MAHLKSSPPPLMPISETIPTSFPSNHEDHLKESADFNVLPIEDNGHSLNVKISTIENQIYALTNMIQSVAESLTRIENRLENVSNSSVATIKGPEILAENSNEIGIGNRPTTKRKVQQYC